MGLHFGRLSLACQLDRVPGPGVPLYPLVGFYGLLLAAVIGFLVIAKTALPGLVFFGRVLAIGYTSFSAKSFGTSRKYLLEKERKDLPFVILGFPFLLRNLYQRLGPYL